MLVRAAADGAALPGDAARTDSAQVVERLLALHASQVPGFQVDVLPGPSRPQPNSVACAPDRVRARRDGGRVRAVVANDFEHAVVQQHMQPQMHAPMAPMCPPAWSVSSVKSTGMCSREVSST